MKAKDLDKVNLSAILDEVEQMLYVGFINNKTIYLFGLVTIKYQ